MTESEKKIIDFLESAYASARESVDAFRATLTPEEDALFESLAARRQAETDKMEAEQGYADHIIPPVRMDQSYVVAADMVAALIGSYSTQAEQRNAGDGPIVSKFSLGLFLWQLLGRARDQRAMAEIMMLTAEEKLDFLDAEDARKKGQPDAQADADA